jgi:hypothetical protein
MIKKIPFMLRHSKHAVAFSSNLVAQANDLPSRTTINFPAVVPLIYCGAKLRRIEHGFLIEPDADISRD